MPQLAIVASGTRGDVQPYVALGKGLRQAGFDVHLLSSANFESLVTEAGLTFHSIGQSVEEVLQSETWRKTLERGNFLAILGQMQVEMKRRAAEFAQRVPSLLQGSDLILTGMAGMSGVYSIAENLSIPVITAHVFPFTATRAFPSPLVPKLPFGNALNRLSFHVTHQMFWQTSKAGDVATRKALRMPKGSFWGPFARMHTHPAVLYGYSRHVLPPPADWPTNHHITGYWFLDAPDGWVPPDDLVAFLEAGPPPVYIGFGSMRSGDPEAAGRIALEALERSGQRGIIASGWGGLKPSSLPKTVHLIASIPHSWLFPRMAAVVHHGGAGTTAAGLGAGVPSVVIPFMGDQAFWGQRIVDLGVGPVPIPRKKLTSTNLASAITQAITDETMRQKARELGEAIRTEDGIENAVTVIERVTRPVAVPR